MAGMNLEAPVMRRHLLLLTTGSSTLPSSRKCAQRRLQCQYSTSELSCRPTSSLGRSGSSVLELRRATFPKRASTNQHLRISQPRPRHRPSSYQIAPKSLRDTRRDLRELRCVPCVICGADSCVDETRSLRCNIGRAQQSRINIYLQRALTIPFQLTLFYTISIAHNVFRNSDYSWTSRSSFCRQHLGHRRREPYLITLQPYRHIW
jgi:hypothetical protein